MCERMISVGKKVFNLRYMVTKEEYEGEPDDPPPGVIRVTMEPGKTFHLSGSRADEFLKGLGQYLGSTSTPGGIIASTGMQTTGDDPPGSTAPGGEGEPQPPDDRGQDPPADQHRA